MSQQIPDHWITIAKRIHAISKSGLAFTKDPFDRERYSELLDMSILILNHITGIDTQKLEFIYNREVGYETPKIGIRAVVCKDEKILMVQEKMDRKWCLPGGYAETGMSPSEIVIKEVKEESGFEVKPVRILGLINYNKHQERPFPFDIYNLFMECEIIGGKATSGSETIDVGLFHIDQLPELSVRRVTKEQVECMYRLYFDKTSQPLFD